ncbi:MAG: outer membrane beta-barrel protein [Muribaculaceae bacterium]|nr:outer membrane beta-barrel protein [Muribaculaceae bacterium]
MDIRNTLKHALMAAVAVMAAIAPAAAQSAAPFFDTSRTDKFIYVGVHVGEGISTIRQNYSQCVPSVSDFILTPGNRFDVGLTATIPVRNFFAIGTGFDFTVNNYYWTMTMLDREQGTLSSLYNRNRYYNVELPAYLQFRFNLGSKVMWRNDVGVYVSFGTGGHSDTRVATSSTNSLGQSQVTETMLEHKYYKDEAPVINGFESFDFGFRLATGIVAYKHYTVDAVFNVGATELARNMGVLDVKAKTLNLTFKVGYLF